MRTIKFRGRVKGTEYFAYGEVVRNFCFEPNGKTRECVICTDNDYTVVEPDSIDQFTGRKVKGSELYENDIVLSLDGEEMTVVWSEDDFCWYFKTESGALMELYTNVETIIGVGGRR